MHHEEPGPVPGFFVCVTGGQNGLKYCPTPYEKDGDMT